MLEEALLDHRTTAFAGAGDDLLVGEHSLVVRAPVDGPAPPIGEVALEELEKDPLRPFVIVRISGR